MAVGNSQVPITNHPVPNVLSPYKERITYNACPRPPRSSLRAQQTNSCQKSFAR
jgi:hypothetical protein